MASRLRSLVALFASLVFLCLVASPAARAHPPHAPFLNPFGKDTKFGPITRFGPKVSIELVADGMTAPLKGVAAPGLSRWLFVVDQPGVVWAVDLTNSDTETNKIEFLNVRALIVTLGVCGPSSFDERGLLGIAFHPRFQQNGLFYTYTSERRDGGAATIATPGTTAVNADHHNVVAEWQRQRPCRPAAGVKPARRELMRVDWPQFNHDGGDLAFGPDGMLYIPMGDGGGADDTEVGHSGDGNAQKLNRPAWQRSFASTSTAINPANAIPHSREQPVRRPPRRGHGDLGLRLPEPFPLLVRPQDRDLYRRRRRPERHRGGRSHRQGRQLRLEPQGRHAVLRRQRCRSRRGFTRRLLRPCRRLPARVRSTRSRSTTPTTRGTR